VPERLRSGIGAGETLTDPFVYHQANRRILTSIQWGAA